MTRSSKVRRFEVERQRGGEGIARPRGSKARIGLKTGGTGGAVRPQLAGMRARGAPHGMLTRRISLWYWLHGEEHGDEQ